MVMPTPLACQARRPDALQSRCSPSAGQGGPKRAAGEEKQAGSPVAQPLPTPSFRWRPRESEARLASFAGTRVRLRSSVRFAVSFAARLLLVGRRPTPSSGTPRAQACSWTRSQSGLCWPLLLGRACFASARASCTTPTGLRQAGPCPPMRRQPGDCRERGPAQRATSRSRTRPARHLRRQAGEKAKTRRSRPAEAGCSRLTLAPGSWAAPTSPTSTKASQLVLLPTLAGRGDH